MRTLAAWLALGLSTAFADIVYIKGGGKVEGVARRESGRVVVETERGTVTIPSEQVLFIDTDHQAPRELYAEKLEALKDSRSAKDFMDLALWASENKLQNVYAYLFEKAAFLSKDEAELQSHLETARAHGLGSQAQALVFRSLELTRESKDVRLLIDFAAAARNVGAPEVKKILLERAFDLTTRTTDPREVLSVAAKARELGFVEELTPFITRAAGLCAGKDAEFLEDLIEDMRQRGLNAHTPRFYRKILDLDPDHEKARRALGYHRHGDQWLTHDEWQVAQGNVRYEGTWMSPAERDFRIREKSLKLEEEARELERERRKLDDARRRVEEDRRAAEEARRRLDDDRRAVEARERRVADRETELARFSHCGGCNVWYLGRHTCLNRFVYCGHCSVYYTGTHICSHSHVYCRGCAGYFSRPHSCRK